MKKLIYFFVLLFNGLLYGANYYWVGGSGSWTDINHWRTSSGGTAIPSVIPGPTDDVYFDDNSGFTSTDKTVTLNTTGNCRNIRFIGTGAPPIFKQTGVQTLNIYGSSEWQTGMPTIEISIINYQNTTSTKTIKSNGVKVGIFDIYNTNGMINFNESTSITLEDNFHSESLVKVNAGALYTNGNSGNIITFVQNLELSGNTTIIYLGDSIVYFTGVKSTFNTSATGVSIDAGTSHIYFTNLINPSNTTGIVARLNQVFNNVSFKYFAGSVSGNAKFNRVEFEKDGFIYGNNQFNELLLAPSQTYQLEAGRTQTIINTLVGNTAQCNGWSTIKSTRDNYLATINASSTAVIAVSGAILKDLSAVGGATFQALYSIDNGNTNGWTFPNYTGRELFWVGGSGNWNDKQHWAESSGGVGGYCIPGPKDNTTFDNNSGFTTSSKTIVIDNTSYTNDIKFIGNGTEAPTLIESGAQKLFIYGSSEWQSGMPNIRINTITYANNNTPKTIKSNGVKFGLLGSGTMFFKENTSITLLDNLDSEVPILISEGTFNTNDKNITLIDGFKVDSGSGNPIIINLGSSVITITGVFGNFDTAKSYVTVNPGTSEIIFTKLSRNTNGTGMVAYQNQEFHNVTFSGTDAAISGNAKFNRVKFNSRGSIYGNNTFAELVFSPSKEYSIESGKTQTIKNLFSSTTNDCEGWIMIKSTVENTSTKIKAESANTTINVLNTILQDIHTEGSANFIANQSYNGGNNTGWIFPEFSGRNLYWVGGSGNWSDKQHWSTTRNGTGGTCIPGPKDNTFFTSDSGFTTSNNTVNIDGTSYTNNITFESNITPPNVIEISTQTLNIYGSSVWKSGMPKIDINQIIYQNSNTNKSIQTNGVSMGKNRLSSIYIKEKTSVSLLDDLNSLASIYLSNGTFNTNNFALNLNSSFIVENSDVTINLGSSVVRLADFDATFNTNKANVIVQSSGSQLLFTGLNQSITTKGLIAHSSQTFDKIKFSGPAGAISGGAAFSDVEFLKNGALFGNNKFQNLLFTAGNTYNLEANSTQTIDNWFIGGTPCAVTIVQSSSPTINANIKIEGSNTEFNFANIKNLTAIGNGLHFGEQSTVENQNNINITNDPYNPGAFSGFDGNLTCYSIDFSDPTSYLISSKNFYGNTYTQYTWYKKNPINNTWNAISTDPDLDLRIHGYGEYRITVNYGTGSEVTCTISDTINVESTCADGAWVNPNLRFKGSRF